MRVVVVLVMVVISSGIGMGKYVDIAVARVAVLAAHIARPVQQGLEAMAVPIRRHCDWLEDAFSCVCLCVIR